MEKYADMLKERLEELKDVDLIDNRTNIETDDEKVKPKAARENLNTGSERKRKGFRKGKPGVAKKRFVEKEDKILWRAIRKGKDGDVKSLAKTLNRNAESVRNRIVKLKTGVSIKVKKSFTLEEDLFILDAALEHFHQVQSIKETRLLNLRETSDRLKRNIFSVYNRWENLMKVWLIGYYSKTLNLDVRIMLANFLADNFASVSSIDWEQVSRHKEFSGQTERSLRKLFFAYIMKHASWRLNVDTSQLTLRQVAESAEVSYRADNVRKVSQNVQTRQLQIIEYFEKKKSNVKEF